MRGGRVRLVRLVFAENHGSDRAEVFRGRVQVPAAPLLSHRDGATWSLPHAVEVPLAPFPYSGGSLCIDLDGAALPGVSSGWWRADFELLLHDAGVLSVGAGCDPRSRAAVSRSTLLPGGSVDLLCSGPAGAVGVLALDASTTPPGIDLGFMGAPGCRVLVLPALMLGGVFGASRPGTYGDIDLVLRLPATGSLLGRGMAVQWVVYPSPVNAARLTTTNALELQVSSLPSRLPGVLVRSGPRSATDPAPASGRVLPHVMPVLRLGYR